MDVLINIWLPPMFPVFLPLCRIHYDTDFRVLSLSILHSVKSELAYTLKTPGINFKEMVGMSSWLNESMNE